MFIFLTALFIIKLSKNAVFSVPYMFILHLFIIKILISHKNALYFIQNIAYYIT